MPVEIDPRYRAELENNETVPPESEPAAAESEPLTADQARDQMAALEANYPKIVSFKPDSQLAIEAARLQHEIEELEGSLAGLPQKVAGYEYVAESGQDISRKMKERQQMEQEPIEERLAALKFDVSVRQEAVQDLKANGRNKWADRYFGRREAKAAAELRAAQAELAEAQSDSYDAAADPDAVIKKAEAAKAAATRVQKAQSHLKMAADQRRYLELMAAAKPDRQPE
jgi:hypothetical protein